VGAADFSAEALARAPGVDPWTLARKVTAADPDMLVSTATAYAAKAEDAAVVARAGRDADRAAAAFTNNGAPVYDAESPQPRNSATPRRPTGSQTPLPVSSGRPPVITDRGRGAVVGTAAAPEPTIYPRHRDPSGVQITTSGPATAPRGFNARRDAATASPPRCS
jgi:hypothetical protein